MGKGQFKMIPALDGKLRSLPAGSRVAICTMRGSMCPITRAHVEMMVEARKLLLESKVDGEYAECVGFLTMNSDRWVGAKLSGEMCTFVQRMNAHRKELIEMSIADIPWLHLSTNGEMEAVLHLGLYPRLNIEHFSINGEDDVLKYKKWTNSGPHNRYITIGRAFSETRLSKDIETKDFIIAPPVGEISSTQVREACRANDRAALEKMVHPRVADWLLAG
eukprot:CAMPEP_0181290260 /NCGR_PEP_ID=MMETSP1101-20121128/1320_1 /TAXON_ID=46948 /ORGANISM="Rhodomonas abbreviata, Strain Caron Lab Isolate" /LENGTH=219 /DNA_ID=CAMNT_0023394535 /DNA_START=110 /DNA_END=769 /DNA_ORIENTATION=+